MHRVTVDVTPLDGTPSDSRTVRTGLREVRMKRWIATVNGERLFLKGSNQGPTRMALAEATAAELERDVVLAKDAGLDLLRVHAHVSRPELYEAADRHGLLLWQDMPLQWGYARGARSQAARQARELVDLLGHHPSVAVWCGHNEPMALDVEPGTPLDSPRVAGRFFVAQELPSFNKTVLDGSIKRTLERSDATRPVVAHSGVFPHPGSGGTDTHLYFGWYHGDERDFPALCARFPRLARFVTEFGAQAVPETADFMEPQRWPDLDWDRLVRDHSLQKHIFDRHVPPAESATFETWRAATQAYQATVIRHHVEALRRLKYRPTGGFCQFSFADGHPGVTWSVLDHERVPKAGYHALAAACAPVIVTADRPDRVYPPGAALALDVHVVSDLRAPVEGMVAKARLLWEGGGHTWGWEGDVPADSCVRVGTIQALVPELPGPFALELTLDGPNIKATNAYHSMVASLD
jgi:beta-mannosidase